MYADEWFGRLNELGAVTTVALVYTMVVGIQMPLAFYIGAIFVSLALFWCPAFSRWLDPPPKEALKYVNRRLWSVILGSVGICLAVELVRRCSVLNLPKALGLNFLAITLLVSALSLRYWDKEWLSLSLFAAAGLLFVAMPEGASWAIAESGVRQGALVSAYMFDCLGLYFFVHPSELGEEL